MGITLQKMPAAGFQVENVNAALQNNYQDPDEYQQLASQEDVFKNHVSTIEHRHNK